MNPERIIQLIPAVGWHVRIDSGFEDVVAFGLTRDGRVLPLVVDKNDSIVELKGKEFSLVGPINFKTLERAAALQNGEYGRLR
jgi:hypothetical protein